MSLPSDKSDTSVAGRGRAAFISEVYAIRSRGISRQGVSSLGRRRAAGYVVFLFPIRICHR